MARVKAARAVTQYDAVLARANRLAAETMRIVKLIELVARLPAGRMREEMKSEVDRQMEALGQEVLGQQAA